MGESFPAENHVRVASTSENEAARDGVLFLGTSTVSGSAPALVIATGKITRSREPPVGSDTSTHLQSRSTAAVGATCCLTFSTARSDR